MSTRGDELLQASLANIGGKGLFIKELETALADGRADLAVHSMKDLPAELPPGFTLAAITARDDPRDAFVSDRYAGFSELPGGAIVGTSSLRRQAQVLERYPDLEVRPLRGNVETRLAKLDRGEYAAIVLAAAGLNRLGLAHRARNLIPVEESLPAPGQAALGIECLAARADVPLCVTLSAVTSVITVFTIPFFINLALQTFGDTGQMRPLPILPTLINLASYTLLPLVIGMIIRARATEFARRAEEPLRKGVLYLMAVVLILGVVSSYRQLIDNIGTAGALVVALNLLTMGLGYGIARAFALSTKQAVTITFEVGVQNLALSFAINFNMLQRPDLAVAGLLYAAIMPATALAFVSIGRRWIEADERARRAATEPVR